MKILNITFNKRIGGLEKIYLSYTDMLVQEGHDIYTIIPVNSYVEKELALRNIPIKCKKYISNKLSHLNPFSVWNLRKEIESIKPDIILVHNSRPLRLLQKSVRKTCPIVTVHHGGKLDYLVKYSDHIICIAKYMEKELVAKGFAPDNIHYVPNFLEINRPYRQRKIPQEKKDIVIGTIARLSSEKGIDVFLEALSMLTIPYKGLVAGDGPLKPDLEQYAKKNAINVEFLGWLHDSAKDKFFDMCDILVIPSRFEPFGLTIIEGWENSLPVIATKSKGAKEIIRHNDTGFLVEIDDATSIARKISEISENYNSSVSITHTAYDTLLKEYSYETSKEHLISTLTKIIAFPLFNNHRKSR